MAGECPGPWNVLSFGFLAQAAQAIVCYKHLLRAGYRLKVLRPPRCGAPDTAELRALGAQHTSCQADDTLTLHVPCPPDGVVEPDLVPPLKLQALEVFPLWRH